MVPSQQQPLTQLRLGAAPPANATSAGRRDHTDGIRGKSACSQGCREGHGWSRCMQTFRFLPGGDYTETETEASERASAESRLQGSAWAMPLRAASPLSACPPLPALLSLPPSLPPSLSLLLLPPPPHPLSPSPSPPPSLCVPYAGVGKRAAPTVGRRLLLQRCGARVTCDCAGDIASLEVTRVAHWQLWTGALTRCEQREGGGRRAGS